MSKELRYNSKFQWSVTPVMSISMCEIFNNQNGKNAQKNSSQVSLTTQVKLYF